MENDFHCCSFHCALSISMVISRFRLPRSNNVLPVKIRALPIALYDFILLISVFFCYTVLRVSGRRLIDSFLRIARFRKTSYIFSLSVSISARPRTKCVIFISLAFACPSNIRLIDKYRRAIVNDDLIRTVTYQFSNDETLPRL